LRLPFVAKERAKPAERLLVGPLARGHDQPFEAGDPGPDDLPSAQALAGKLEQQAGLVVFQGARQQPIRKRPEVRARGVAKAQVALDLL
jgi:hypothetical protein